MKMGQEQRIDLADRDLELKKPHRYAAPGIDEEFLIRGLDQSAGPETFGTRYRNAGAEKSDAEVARLAHCWIFIPESLTTWAQCDISDFTNSPNAFGVPPAGTAPRFP